MILMKLILKSTKLSLIAIWLLLGLPFISLQFTTRSFAQQPANPSQNSNSSGQVIFQNNNNPPSGLGGPSGVPGGKRPACGINPTLTAIVPATPNQQTAQDAPRWGLTTQDSPTVWFYVPFAPKFINSIELEIREANEPTQTKKLPKPESSGIIRTAITNSALKEGVWYRVDLVVYAKCNPVDSAMSYTAQAWVLRQPLNSSVKTQLDRANTSPQKAMVYAENGLWYDALTLITELKQCNSDDRHWESLLRSSNLEEFMTKPLLGDCQKN
jgi:hypothetical protein